MQLSRNQKIGIGVVLLAVSFAVGRYTVSEKIRIETKIVEVEKKVVDSAEQKHVKVVVTETDNKDGTKTVITTTTDDSVTDTHSTDTSSTKSDTTKSASVGESKITISALGGYDLSTQRLIYGLSATKPILGPIAIGLFGLSDGTVGASVGISF